MLPTWGSATRRPVAIAMAYLLLLGPFAAPQARAADFWRWANPKPEATHQAPCPPNMITLAKQVTKLEDQVRRNGSITIKQPDVWGESNLMAYIQEYEEQMVESVDKFRETIQGYTLTRDSAQFASSTSLGSGVDDSVFASTQAVAATAATQKDANSTSVPLSQLTALLTQVKPTSVNAKGETATTPFGLEPTELERQHSVYIQMNQALRRTNMGDDNSRAAGNSLYLLRFPVSVLPGRETYEGYSAVITLRAHLVIDDAHLRYTFPKLAVADAVDGVVPILMAYWKQGKVFLADEATRVEPPSAIAKSLGGPSRSQRNSANPLTPGSTRQMILQYGETELTALLECVRDQYGSEKPKQEELRGFLFSQFLNLYEQLIAGGMFTPGDDHPHVLEDLAHVGQALALGDCDTLFQCRCNWNRAMSQARVNCDDHARQFAWILGLNAAALDANIWRLIEARDRASGSPPSDRFVDPLHRFYVVDGPWQSEINATWVELIEAEFPVHVFALNPMIEEQNVYDAFSRSRDLQIAFAMAVANGNMRAGQAMRFSRQVSLEMAAIGLNRTAVAFAHGNDTFGWYFHPRVQSPPPERSNVAALGRLLWSSGPTERYDQRHQVLDPGIRECEAVIVMPGFVPAVRFDVITNWEKRAKPGAVKRDYAEMIVEGQEILNTLNYAANVGDQACYRSADYDVLVSRVEQIEKMLPLQAVNVRLPFEHEMSGSEIFDGGQSQLKPRLDGFYGLNYVSGKDKAEVFLTGGHFHPVLTRVILGGREAEEVKILSRELLKVKFKYVAKPLTNDPVEIRIATPAGISPPEFIPLMPTADSKSSAFTWGTKMPLRCNFSIVDCKPQLECFPIGNVAIKYAVTPKVAAPAVVDVLIVPKLLTQDGGELVAADPSSPISLGVAALAVPLANLQAPINAYLAANAQVFSMGLSSYKISADVYLVLGCSCTPVKVDGPLVIELTAKPCPCPKPETKPCAKPPCATEDKTLLEEVEPMMIPAQELPPQSSTQRTTLRLVAGDSKSTTTLRPKVRRANLPDASHVRQAGATLRR